MAKKDKVPDSWVDYVNDLYQRGNQARWMYMAQWMQCFHFYVGNQWIKWNKQKADWEANAQLDGRIQFVANKILSAFRMVIGRMLKEQYIQLVLHANNDENSMDTAKSATRFLDYVARITDMESIHKEVFTWAGITGMGLAKYYIDPDKGPTRKTSKKPDGEIKIDVISPFEFVVPANARSMERLPWAMHARMETCEWVYENYDVEVEATGNASDWAIYQAAVQNITTDTAFFGTNLQFEKDSVLVKELWVRPCKKFPNGKVIIVAGDKIVFNDDIPYDKEYWPFNHLPFIDVPFRFWPMGLVEPMIDTQKASNLMSSQILENIRYMGNPIVLSPLGSVEPDSMVAEPGANWEYNPAMGKPELVTPNPVPPEIHNEKAQLEAQIYDIAGIHMMGSGAGGVRAAAAVMLYEQQDETEYLPIGKNVEAYLKRDAEIKLFLAQKAFSMPRKLRVLGSEGQWEIHEFNASDLTGDEEVVIQTKQEFANDKMTRFNQTLQLVQMRDENGQPYLDRQSVLKILDIEGLDGITTDFDLDYNRAKWENEQILDGETVNVNDYDDHATHIKIHNQQRKRLDFEKLPQHIQDAFAQHVLAHQQMLSGQSGTQTQAKGDETPQQQPQMGQQGPQMPGMMPDSASGLQSGVSAVQNMIAQPGQM